MNEQVKVSAETIARTVFLFLSLANIILAQLGYKQLPIQEADIYTFVSVAWVIVASIWAWWKDNPFTKAAIMSDQVKQDLRGGATVTVQDGDNITVMDKEGEVTGEMTPEVPEDDNTGQPEQ